MIRSVIPHVCCANSNPDTSGPLREALCSSAMSHSSFDWCACVFVHPPPTRAPALCICRGTAWQVSSDNLKISYLNQHRLKIEIHPDSADLPHCPHFNSQKLDIYKYVKCGCCGRLLAWHSADEMHLCSVPRWWEAVLWWVQGLLLWWSPDSRGTEGALPHYRHPQHRVSLFLTYFFGVQRMTEAHLMRQRTDNDD